MKGNSHAHAISKELRGHIVAVITGNSTDADAANGESVAEQVLQTLVGDLQMLASAHRNSDNDAVVDWDDADFATHLYAVTRRAKSALWLAQFIDETLIAEERGKSPPTLEQREAGQKRERAS